jgi:hypothetical protein
MSYEELATEHSNRILECLMKAKKQVGIHDPVFEPKAETKAVEQPKEKPQENPIDAMFKAFEQPQTVENQPLDAYVKAQFDEIVSSANSKIITTAHGDMVNEVVSEADLDAASKRIRSPKQ